MSAQNASTLIRPLLHSWTGGRDIKLFANWFLRWDGDVWGYEHLVEKHKLRYTSMIADGDSSTYPTIRDAMPYGKEHPIVKHECVGHVQKRMYNRLKAMKQRHHDGPDGKAVRIGGRGRLTDELMKRLQRFYGKAIRSNMGNAIEMQRAVMATYYHCVSTDAHPLHFLCPPGKTSWCKFKRAEAKQESPPSH